MPRNPPRPAPRRQPKHLIPPAKLRRERPRKEGLIRTAFSNRDRVRSRRHVAQICNLLYRRIAFCYALRTATTPEKSNARQNTILRYSRLQICATRRASVLVGVLWCLALLSIVVI